MKKKKNIVIKVLFGLILFVCLTFLAIWLYSNNEAKEITNRSQSYLKKTSNKYYLDPLIKEQNPYTVGWLKVEGTDIDYPVVQYTDNSYYLNHDYYDDRNSNGWVFLDSKSKLSDQNLIIYGQFNLDGSIFGTIDELLKVGTEKDKSIKNTKSNNKIIFITENDYIEYTIFSGYIGTDYDDYLKRNFKNINDTLKVFNERSEVPFGENINGVDHIITLSTINEKDIDRMVIQGYRNNN